jgi:hypothetical protein
LFSHVPHKEWILGIKHFAPQDFCRVNSPDA